MRPPTEPPSGTASDVGSDRPPRRTLARRGEAGCRPAHSVLGPHHPLSHAIVTLQNCHRHSAVVGAILLVSGAAAIQGVPWAPAVTVSAAIVEIGFGIAAAFARQRRRDCALQLIVDGGEAVQVRAVQRERQRLSSLRARRRLADAIDEMIECAAHPPKLCLRGTRPLYSIRVLAAAAAELREITLLLRSGQPTIRGVALTERLITDGMSPLYGDEPNALREEVHRICRLMGT